MFHKSLPSTRRCRPSEEESSSNTKYCRRRERTICKTATLPTLQRTRHTREPHSRHVTANIIAKHKRRHSLHSKTKTQAGEPTINKNKREEAQAQNHVLVEKVNQALTSPSGYFRSSYPFPSPTKSQAGVSIEICGPQESLSASKDRSLLLVLLLSSSAAPELMSATVAAADEATEAARVFSTDSSTLPCTCNEKNINRNRSENALHAATIIFAITRRQEANQNSKQTTALAGDKRCARALGRRQQSPGTGEGRRLVTPGIKTGYRRWHEQADRTRTAGMRYKVVWLSFD